MTSPAVVTPTQQKKSETSNSPIPLTTMQKAMFKSMTESLSIPHFGYSDEISLNGLSDSRKLINQYLANSESSSIKKISYMPLFIKALSLALLKFPILNAALVNDDTASTASLLYRSEHNIGIAMDTPQGYLSF
jgi:2-oxoisovalerate dehydrogenase E2 component (dihydrolipoyl transacylase)